MAFIHVVGLFDDRPTLERARAAIKDAGLAADMGMLDPDVPTQRPTVRDILRRNGALDLRRRVTRWRSTGWEEFDPAGLAFTEEEIVEERARNAAAEASTPAGDATEATGASASQQERR